MPNYLSFPSKNGSNHDIALKCICRGQGKHLEGKIALKIVCVNVPLNYLSEACIIKDLKYLKTLTFINFWFGDCSFLNSHFKTFFFKFKNSTQQLFSFEKKMFFLIENIDK